MRRVDFPHHKVTGEINAEIPKTGSHYISDKTSDGYFFVVFLEFVFMFFHDHIINLDMGIMNRLLCRH